MQQIQQQTTRTSTRETARETTRTTIRIRKDLLDQSRRLAFSRGASLQDVINETLAIGYGHITDLSSTATAMRQIDTIRYKIERLEKRAETTSERKHNKGAKKKPVSLKTILEISAADRK